MTAAAPAEPGAAQAASVAVQRATRILLACQEPAGCWPDGATDEVSFAAEAVLVRRFLRTGAEAGQDAATRQQIRSGQRADGSWAGAEPGPAADLSASVLCYLALALTGDSPDAYHMAAAAGWIRDAGGIGAVGITARAWLALFGLTAWAEVPVPAPEEVWPAARGQQPGSRVAAVTLAILGAVRPVRAAELELAELQAAPGRSVDGASARPVRALSTVRSAARPAALRWCSGWLAGWQQGGAAARGPRTGWPLSLVALQVIGRPAAEAAVASGLPPVAQAALALAALRGAGLAAGHPSVRAAAGWLLDRRIEVSLLGPVARGEAASCGWSFCPDGYPRPADTAVVLSALSGIATAGQPVAAATRWLAAMQDRDGGWDGSATATGYCVRALATSGAGDPAAARAIRRGAVWLLRAQQPAGSWPGGAGGCDLVATSVALTALLSAGVRAGKPCITGGAGWLLGQQNADGGWHLGAITGPPGSSDSDAAGTSLALMALLAAGAGPAVSGVAAAARWLIRAQRADGSWAAQPGSRQCSRSRPADGILLPLAALGQYCGVRASPGLAGNLAVGIQHPPRKHPDHRYQPRR